MTVDIDAARAEREAAMREAGKVGPKVRFGGEEYELAVELPFEVVEALRNLTIEEKSVSAMAELTEGLLGEHYQAWLDADMALEDMNVLLKGVMEEYGIAAPLT